MTPKLGTIYDFLMMFEYALRASGTSHDSTWYAGVKNEKKSVKKKNSGASVYLRIYWYILSISGHILSICKSNFVMPSIYFLLFINAQIHLLSTAHCIMEPKVKKGYVQIMNFATPDYTDMYSYILVHTRTYCHATPCTSNQSGAAL
jgi:hypothetical protein